MEQLDQIYLKILHAGIIATRNAADDGDLERCRVEAEHVHNIPTLIGEDNIDRHNYYFKAERVDYWEWLCAYGDEEVTKWAKNHFWGLWKEMEKILESENKKRKE